MLCIRCLSAAFIVINTERVNNCLMGSSSDSFNPFLMFRHRSFSTCLRHATIQIRGNIEVPWDNNSLLIHASRRTLPTSIGPPSRMLYGDMGTASHKNHNTTRGSSMANIRVLDTKCLTIINIPIWWTLQLILRWSWRLIISKILIEMKSKIFTWCALLHLGELINVHLK